MDKIVVACGLMNHSIYAQAVNSKGVVNGSTCIVTRMAIEAVRDYMVGDINDGNSVGYSWKRGDGKTVKLLCVVGDDDEK